MSVDTEWAQIFPHKGPMVVLDIDSSRSCYSLCELDLSEHDVTLNKAPGADYH